MAGDWIKMRVWLRRDPRVASMADYLACTRMFMEYVSGDARHTCKESAHEYITSDITRAITVCALLEIWGVARERGDRDGDDLVLKHCDLANLDDICSVPGMGDALEYVDWAFQETRKDARNREISYVRFPKFFCENESPDDRYKKQHAEAQARYRAKKAAESDVISDAKSDVTSDVTVTPREEKRRVNTTPTPSGFDVFWKAYPRKVGKDAAATAFAKRKPDDVLLQQMLAALVRQSASAAWRKDGGQYIPNPATWLNQGRWMDEPANDSTHDPEMARMFARGEG